MQQEHEKEEKSQVWNHKNRIQHGSLLSELQKYIRMCANQ